MHVFSFEKLDVWQYARGIVKDIYLLTQRFPDNDRFGLVSQMRRSAISMVSNIAEGAARLSAKEQARFSEIAYASSLELHCQLIVAYDIGFIDTDKYETIKEQTSLLAFKVNALYKSQINRAKS